MCKVLLVDDEYMILSGLQYLIPWEELNLTLVGTASNGQEAFEIVQSKEVDIVVSDITMPVLSGIEFLRKTCLAGKNIKTIFLSGYQEFEYVKEGMSLGAVDYLVKPVDKNELYNSLKKCIQMIQNEKNQEEYVQLKFQQQLKEWLRHPESTDLIEQFDLYNRESFNVFVGEYEEEAFIEYLKSLENVHYFYEGEKKIVGIVIDYNKERLTRLYHTMAEKFPKGVFVFAGTHKNSYLDVLDSYNVAVTLRESYYFYNLVQDGCVWLELNNQLEKIYYSNAYDLPLISKEAEDQTLERKIQKIVNYFERSPIPPNHVRYFMLLILADARSYYDVDLGITYQEEIDRVRGINNVSQIRDILMNLKSSIQQQLSSRSYSELTQKVIHIVYENYHRDLLLKEIAEQLFVNPMYLGQLIKKETGQTFAQYLNSYRMKKAKELLLKSHKTVNEIAHEVGYSSTGYFHKNFKEAFQLTPKDYREQFLSW